jgi:hypothetical protein
LYAVERSVPSVPAAKSSTAGVWRIGEMELWDSDVLDLVGPATLEVAADGTGSMRFLGVGADVDGRHLMRDG